MSQTTISRYYPRLTPRAHCEDKRTPGRTCSTKTNSEHLHVQSPSSARELRGQQQHQFPIPVLELQVEPTVWCGTRPTIAALVNRTNCSVAARIFVVGEMFKINATLYRERTQKVVAKIRRITHPNTQRIAVFFCQPAARKYHALLW